MARTLKSKPILFEFPEWITGHHIYKDIWSPTIGEILLCETEKDNKSDQYAVSIVHDGRVVGHVPRSFSKVATFIIAAGGRVQAKVTGERANSRKNGLEVPCIYSIKGPKHIIDKAILIIEDILRRGKQK